VATNLEKMKWNLFRKKYEILFKYGVSKKLISPYECELIEKLRTVYYGGVPASILLTCDELCGGHCYDRALLVTLGFGDDDFNLVDADIDGITLNPKHIDEFKDTNDIHYGNHCFVERTKSDGSVWVYDTSLGLVIEKKLYYLMERPRITKINSREDTINFCEYQDIKNADIKKDKYALPLIMPNIEAIAKKSEGIYSEFLKKEIELFKQRIGYGDICDEIEEEMKKRGYTNSLYDVIAKSI